MKKLLTTLCLLASAPLMASTVYTNESVDYKNFRAYRSLSSCLNWYHMPAEFNELSSYITYSKIQRVRVPKAGDPNSFENARGYGFFVDLQLTPPVLQNADEEALKLKIAKFVNGIVSRNKTDKKYAHYTDCPSYVDAKDITLSRLLVRNKTDVTTLKSAINSVKPNSALNIKKTDSIDILRDAYHPVDVSLMYDLSNPQTGSIFNQTFDGKQKTVVGESRFMLHGKERVYDASLTLTGEMSASWVSELTTVECKNSNSNSSTGLSGSLSMPGSQYMPSMQSFGNTNASLGLTEKREVSVCLQKLLTRMADAKSNLKFVFDIDRNIKMDNKFVTECENGECHQIPLENWIKITLLDMWVKSNFTVITQELANNTYSHTVKPSGDTRALINTSVNLGENFILDVDLATPVILKEVKQVYPYQNSTSQRFNCFWESYADQSFVYELDSKTSLIPVTKACNDLKD
jgi:hypothetical protein